MYSSNFQLLIQLPQLLDCFLLLSCLVLSSHPNLTTAALLAPINYSTPMSQRRATTRVSEPILSQDMSIAQISKLPLATLKLQLDQFHLSHGGNKVAIVKRLTFSMIQMGCPLKVAVTLIYCAPIGVIASNQI